jgi:hypothetical protein
MNDERFMSIPPGAIIPGSLPKFRIYVRSPEGHYILWALEGNEVSPAQIDTLSQSGRKEVYVDLEEGFKYEQYLEDNLGSVLDNKASTDEQKATLFSIVSTNVVKGAFENSLGLGTMTSDSLERTKMMVKNALMFITESGSLQALSKMIGHDYQTYEHATKVLWFTVAYLNENPTVLEQIHTGYQSREEDGKTELLRQCGVGALLHDIGKAFVSPEVLNKNGPLDPVEWEMMKRHPLSGMAMLLDTDTPDFVKKAVLHHHEDYHGGGYPLNLQGRSISILARVLRIIDVFDAMTSRRPYKDPLSPGKAMKIMVGIPEDETKKADPAAPADRDQGMRRCFDEDLLRRFVLFLGKANLVL